MAAVNQDSNSFARNHQKRFLFEHQNLLEGGSKIFFCLPANIIAGYIALEHKNCPGSEVYRLTSSDSWQGGKKAALK